MLGQDVHTHPQRSDTVRLCTLIKHPGFIFSAEHRRWLSARELLAAQGFPTTPTLVAAATTGRVHGDGETLLMSMCSFNVADEDVVRRGFKARQRSSMAGQAGDAMNVNTVGAAMVFFLGFVVRADTDLRTG